MKNNETQMSQNNDFDGLVAHIQQTQDVLQNNARLVINRHVTAKAWLTGYYIVEYEQKGADRAKYGEQLLKKLAEKLKDKKTFSYRSLNIYRKFYLAYPALNDQIMHFVLSLPSIVQTVSAQFQLSVNHGIGKMQTVPAELPIATLGDKEIQTKPELLFNKLSFSHLSLLLSVTDPLERAFYETMAIRGTWSVRELQRQIDSNYYFRCGWSQKPEALAKLVEGKAETDTLALDIKSPFTFEFLGLQAKDVVEESDLETALITHLQDFILELGMGFCFEERQKKMLIDDRYFKADLVFYHRILKRHVIIELKANRLNYADAAQLHMYLAYYRKNIMQPDDNPPIGILLCSEVGQEMAEYSLLDLDESVFISKYQLNVPSKERMTEFLRKENEGIYNKV